MSIHSITLQITFAVWIFVAANLLAQPSPTDFLGYPAGTSFTPHHRITDYFEAIGSQSDRVVVIEYGRTWEGRPLTLAFVSTPANLALLDSIQEMQMKLLQGGGPGADLAITWLSFGIHGDEGSSSEAAMELLYQLTRTDDPQMEEWLSQSLVIIDPCLNPDGRERYTNWYRSVLGSTPSVDPASREHNQPWPGGRYNHYYFDLNRDWSWATQIETKARLREYNKWLPHIHIDFHEQDYTAGYYFGPAVQPYHSQIHPWQDAFQNILASNHRKHFDARGWLYFSKERFDLLYPGYGDTYAMLSGAAGITYEAPGGVGLGIRLPSGDTLRLSDRIERHTLAAMSTIETAVAHRKALRDGLARYFNEYRSLVEDGAYLIRVSDAVSCMSLRSFFELHGIRSFNPMPQSRLRATPYGSSQTRLVDIDADDLIVPISQPKYRLLRALMEPLTELNETETYDVTAWNLPYAFGLDVYILPKEPRASEQAVRPAASGAAISGEPYAWLVNWSGMEDARLLASLHADDIRIRRSVEEFSYGSMNFGRGSLIISQNDNRNQVLSVYLEPIRYKYPGRLHPVYGGAGDSTGTFSIGSSTVRPLKRPSVALMSGPECYAQNLGEIWFYLEHNLGLQVNLIDQEELEQTDLRSYTHLIIPSGRYTFFQDDEIFHRLDIWIRDGGILLLMQSAIDAFTGDGRFGLQKVQIREDSLAKPGRRLYADRNSLHRRRINPGAVVLLEIDSSHPVGFGYSGYWHSLLSHNRLYAQLDDGWNVAITAVRPAIVNGHTGADYAEHLPDKVFVGVENRGSGSVVYYVSNPVYRAFWQSGAMLLANTLFQMP